MNLREIAKRKIESNEDPTHDWEHTKRVLGLCKSIGEKEGSDMNILETAALLHDTENSREDHEIKSSEFAEKVLNERGWEKEDIEKVSKIIREHRFSKNTKPGSTESKVLQDADRLESTGAIGIGRMFLFTGMNKEPYDTALKGIYDKTLKLEMNTKEGDKIKKERNKFVKEFLKNLEKENFKLG